MSGTGRTVEETIGADPYVVAMVGTAYVRGLQPDPHSPNHLSGRATA